MTSEDYRYQTFKLMHKPLHVFTVGSVIRVKLILFYREAWGKWDAERLVHLFTKVFTLSKILPFAKH